MLPQSLIIQARYDRTGNPRYSGAFADVWKGQYQGREVAVKGLRVALMDDPKKIRRVGCWLCPQLVIRVN